MEATSVGRAGGLQRWVDRQTVAGDDNLGGGQKGSMDVLVAGVGFIGGHLVATPLEQRLALRSVDMKPIPEWYNPQVGAETVREDLSPARTRAADPPDSGGGRW